MNVNNEEYLAGQVKALQYIVLMLYAALPRSSQRDLGAAIPKGLAEMGQGLLPKTEEFLGGVESVRASFYNTERAVTQLSEAKHEAH